MMRQILFYTNLIYIIIIIIIAYSNTNYIKVEYYIEKKKSFITSERLNRNTIWYVWLINLWMLKKPQRNIYNVVWI